MYAEDLELGCAPATRGSTLFWPAARVVHTGGHSTPGLRRRAVRAARRAAPDGRARAARAATRTRADDLLQAVTFADRLLLKRLARRPADRERRQLAARCGRAGTPLPGDYLLPRRA